MDLKKKTIYIPGFVPGETRDEMLDNLMTVVLEIQSPRERHILRYCKRARIRKKYINRLTREAVTVIFIRRFFLIRTMFRAVSLFIDLREVI